MSTFNGYTQQTFEFFMALRYNNNREFFHANYEWYLKSVREPSLALIEQLSPFMAEIDPDMDLRAYRVLSHINRDIRFARDKSPYKDYIWFRFRAEPTAECNSPGFFFDLSDNGANVGMGLYRLKAAQKKAFRTSLLQNSGAWLELLEPLSGIYHPEFELQERISPPAELPEALRFLYCAQGFWFGRGINDFELLKSAALADAVKQDFSRLRPLFEQIKKLAL